MGNINSYLTFNGNCLEAMNFYKESLGGELTFQTVGETNSGNQMPEQMKDFILHSTLKSDDIILMASDMAGKNGVQKGNNISLMLNCNSAEHIRDCFEKLSAGGKQNLPLDKTYWGAIFGSVTDKFGNQWLLNYQAN